MRPVAATLAVATAAWLVPGAAPHAPPLAGALAIRRRIDGTGVALTFDDGPHRDGTPAVLAALAARGARATFFLVGEQVERLPSLAAEIAAAGHAIALHGHTHRNQMLLTPRSLAEDLRRGAVTIAEATGYRPRTYRPPYGIFTPAGLALARRSGWTPMLWSTWGRDWNAQLSPERIAALATRGIDNGDVVLLHDSDHYSDRGSWRGTAAALPRVLDELERRGLGSVRV